MGSSILYLDPLSIHTMADTIAASIGKEKTESTALIGENFSAEKTAATF